MSMKMRKSTRIIVIMLIAVMTITMMPLCVSAASVPAVKNLHAKSPANDKIRLTWNAVPGRSYYTIVAKCDGEKYKKGTYKVKAKQYTFTEVPRGHKYSFRVRTVINGKKSAERMVSIRLGIILDEPTIKAKSPGYRRNDISWKAVPNAQGYTVVETDLATNKTTTKKVAADATEISFRSKTIGNKYSYKVQAYARDNGKLVKSDWSKEVTVTSKRTYIGQAAADYDKKAGDGNGKEVLSSKWLYSSSATSCRNWTYVFRLKDPAKADAAATMLEKAIANDNIGYNSNGTKAYGENACQKLAAKVNYDLSKITIKTGCSCGDIVMLAIKSTGLNVLYTGSGLCVAAELKKWDDDFYCYTSDKYVANDDYLERGDILVTAHSNGKNNHVCMVL